MPKDVGESGVRTRSAESLRAQYIIRFFAFPCTKIIHLFYVRCTFTLQSTPSRRLHGHPPVGDSAARACLAATEVLEAPHTTIVRASERAPASPTSPDTTPASPTLHPIPLTTVVRASERAPASLTSPDTTPASNTQKTRRGGISRGASCDMYQIMRTSVCSLERKTTPFSVTSTSSSRPT